MSFSELGLSSTLIEACGFAEPTPIQREAIPAVLEGRDVLGIAKTGSGKTASYVLPILQRMMAAQLSENREPTTLILVPTRESDLTKRPRFGGRGEQVDFPQIWGDWGAAWTC